MTDNISRPTLDKTNPQYFDLVRERTDNKIILDCYVQTNDILKRHQKLDSCLDIGCASGYLYQSFRKSIKKYTGLDPSKKFIDYGVDYFQKECIDNVELYCGWFENFKTDTQFDVITCLGLFYRFPNYHWYMERMFSLTKKLIVIRALFEDKTEYRYVPEKPESDVFAYYNIYSFVEITQFAASRGWNVMWEEDYYLKKIGGCYETAGQNFPFKFLVLSR